MATLPQIDADVAAQRMEALGRLAGGVAHDFNNHLMVINGYAELLAQSAVDDDSKDAVQAILAAAERAGNLTHQLLLFSRRQTITPADVPVAPAVRALADALRRLVPDHITLDIVGDDPSLVARIDHGQLDQVVVALVAHARDGMPNGGRLCVEVHRVTREAFVDASGERAPDGDYVHLSVSDTGPGMQEAIRNHVFEPFVATRGTGRRAGLGLATVYGIVKSSGGFVDVTSSPDHGTTFDVFLPLCSAPAVGEVSYR